MSRASSTKTRSTVFLIEDALEIDDQGFTNKKCRNCHQKLSYEEVTTFSPQLKNNTLTAEQKIKNLQKLEIVCLNCYAK